MKSYQYCVRKLKETNIFIDEDGLKIQVKPIPDCEEIGVPDDRVLADYLECGGMIYPKDNNSLTAEDITLVRNQMGSPNKDISTGVFTEEFHIGENQISLYVYRPDHQNNHPVVIYIHGGGFFGGCAKMDENPCKLLAQKANAIVISVEYSLSPENPFPAAMEDCMNALDWVCTHAESIGGDITKISVAGDSAGGNLATVCALRDRDLGLRRIKNQILLYPAINVGKLDIGSKPWDESKYKMNRNIDVLKVFAEDVGKFGELISLTYVKEPGDLKNPYVTPFLAKSFRDMPKTLIVTAEFDYLRLECEEYARRLIQDGISTSIIRYNGVCHAFVEHLGYYPQAEDCIAEIANFINN